MKKTLLLALFALAFLSASAQFQKGRKVISLGFGSNPDYFKGSKGVPIFLGFEYGLTNWLSIGPALDLIMGNTLNYSYIGICPGGRLTFHLTAIKVKNLDVYGGVTAGTRQFLIPDMKPVPSEFENGAYVYGFVGARYKIVKQLGCFVEMSAGEKDPNIARFGLCFMSKSGF